LRKIFIERKNRHYEAGRNKIPIESKCGKDIKVAEILKNYERLSSWHVELFQSKRY
jgi:hypothetical protein